MQPTSLTPSTIPSLPVPGDRIVVVKGKKHPVGSTGTVLATGSKRFGGGISRWAKIRWDLNVEDTFISLDNLSRL